MAQTSNQPTTFEVEASAPLGNLRNSYNSEYFAASTSIHITAAAEGSKAGMLKAMFNLANTIMGAALTSMPFVARKSGAIPFMLFISFSVGIGFTTLRMLISVCDYVPGGVQDYMAVSKAALGPQGPIISACAIWMSCTGALTAYFVLVGDLGLAVLQIIGVNCQDWQAQLGTAMLIIGPLCSLKDVSSLAPASMFACGVFVLMAVTSIVNWFTDDFYLKPGFRIDGYPKEDNGIQWFPSALGLDQIGQFTTIIMAFNCQYAVLPILSNVQSRVKRDLSNVCLGGLSMAYVVYVLVALCAYSAYQKYTDNMVLRNFRHCIPYCTQKDTELNACPAKNWDYKECEEQWFIILLNGLFLLAVLMGYPCVHFALRRAQISVVVGIDSEFSWAVHLGFALFNIGLTFVLATLVGKDVSKVFNWTGAVASPFICFILPSIFYVVILGQEGLPLMTRQRLGGLCVICYGVLVVIIGVTYNIIKMM